jgi:hypothetical protein
VLLVLLDWFTASCGEQRLTNAWRLNQRCRHRTGIIYNWL